MQGQRTLRVGLVGAGHISEFHIRTLRRLRGVHIAGVTDRDPERARALVARFGLPAAFPSLAAMAAQGLDVVHVLTPPASHVDIALEALERGCHVLVEKPLAVRAEDCDRLSAAARARGKTVGVNHSLLADPFVVRALEMVRNGAIGDVRAFDYFRSQSYPPYQGGPLPMHCREGGYPFRDVGVHGLYLAEAFLGAIEDVSAEFSSPDAVAPRFFSEWRVPMRCRHGMGQIHLSWTVKPAQSVLVVQGTHGVLRVDLFGMTITLKKSRRLPEIVQRVANTLGEGWQICTQVPANVVRVLRKKIRQYHGLQDLVAAFYNNLAADLPAPVTAEQARPIVHWTEQVARKADRALADLGVPAARPLRARVLVTGGTGFIGSHLVRRLLEQHDRVRLLVRRLPELQNDPRLEYVLGDLGDPEAVERAVAGTDLVYHLGAALKGNANDFQRGTVQGTRNVVNSVLRNGGRLVYVSSLSVLRTATIEPGQTVREDWPLEPRPLERGSYTRTKCLAEQIVLEAVRQRGLRAVVLRPGQVIGKGGTLLTPAVGLKLKKCLLVFGDGKRTLPLVHVEDLTDGLLQAASAPVFDGSVFHLVDPTPVTQNQLIHWHCQGNGQAARVVRVPWWLSLSMATGAEWLARLVRRAAPVTTYRLKSAAPANGFNCQAAEERLGWKPRRGVLSGLKAWAMAGTQVLSWRVVEGGTLTRSRSLTNERKNANAAHTESAV